MSQLSGVDSEAICHPHTLLLANDSEKLKMFSELGSNSGHCEENMVFIRLKAYLQNLLLQPKMYILWYFKQTTVPLHILMSCPTDPLY